MTFHNDDIGFAVLRVKARGRRHLVLDEADEMASRNPLPEQLRLLGVVDKIVRRGRVRGFRRGTRHQHGRRRSHLMAHRDQ